LTQQDIREESGNQEVQMLRMRSVCSVAAVLSGLIFAGGALAQGIPQGMPMGSMKTAPDNKTRTDTSNPTYGPNQAHLPAGTPERVTPTYRDTTEDRIMREKTDDGAHDSTDTQR
jgi:hypothetical protein